MKRITKIIGIDIYTFDELPEAVKELFRLTANVRNNAQADNSKYYVAAVMVTKDGKIFKGVNVERCSYTQTTHAEQNAVDTSVTELGPTSIATIVVIGDPASKKISFDTIPQPPPVEQQIKDVSDVCPACGHCLQIIVENCFKATGEYDPDVTLWGYHKGEFYCTTIGEALPMPFLPQYLGTNYMKK